MKRIRQVAFTVTLTVCAPMLPGKPAKHPAPPQGPPQSPPEAAPPGPPAPPAEAPAPLPAEQEPAPSAPAGEPLYSLDVRRQNAEDVIMAFAQAAGRTVALLDRGATLITVHFTDLPFEKGFKAILRAADLDFVKNDDGYTVGLLGDLKLRFPDPEDKVIEATYRCRRIAAATLVKTIQGLFPEAEFRVAAGPEFLTPAVERVSGGGSGGGDINALTATDANFHTHDVVFSGPPAMVQRALSLARKFDRPRKQVRVNIRVVQITSNAERNLGVSWMQSLNLTANEVASPAIGADIGTVNNSAPQVNGIRLGRFTHNALSVNATLNALEKAGESRTVANPTLLVLDGEKSFILSGTKYVLPQVSSKDPSGQSIYTTTVEKLGLYLQVGVQVGLDDDMVLSIYPQVTNLTGFTTINTIQYPIISTVEEQATVRAMKGDVIVLGGLKKDVTSKDSNGIPFLSRLPLLGKLFSSDDKKQNSEELMFILTPELVDDPEMPLSMNLKITPGS